MFNIKDKPGCITVDAMRCYFERMVNETPAFATSISLLVSTKTDGSFDHYVDSDTDSIWLGFAMGMRCAERIENTKVTDPSTLLQEAENGHS